MVKRWVWKITRFGYCAGPPKVGTPGPGLGNRQIAAVGRNLCTTGGKTGCGEKNRGAAVGNSWKIGGDNRGIGWEIRPAPPGPSPSGCPHPFPPVFHGLIHRFARGSRPLRRLGAARGRSPAPPAHTGGGLGGIPRKEANTSDLCSPPTRLLQILFKICLCYNYLSRNF